MAHCTVNTVRVDFLCTCKPTRQLLIEGHNIIIIGASLSEPHTSESFRAIVHVQKITTKIGELTRASRI